MLVTVFTSDNIAKIQICQQILDDNDIRHIVKGENVADMTAEINVIMVQVLDEDAEKAREALKEVK